MSNWIRCEDKMPEERESMYNKFYGTPNWKPGMFRLRSDTVIVCVVYEDGHRRAMPAWTNDGKWTMPYALKKHTITHWMPMPELPEEQHEGGTKP